jgi:hypothetical protein
MNKNKKIFTLLFILLSAGIVHTLFILKNIPETFDWNLEEDIDESI